MHNGIYILVPFCLAGFLIIFYFRYWSTLELHNCSIQELKISVKSLKHSKTLYKTHCGFVSPCFKDKQGWHRSIEHTMLHVKKEGILFKPLFSRKFGLQFNNIICIDFKEQKKAYSFPMRIIIYSIGKSKIILQSERNYLLLDALKRVYDGEIRQLD